MRLAVYHQLPSGGGKRALYEMLVRLRNEHEITLYTHRDCEKYLNLTKLAHRVVYLDAFPIVQAGLARVSQKILFTREIKTYELQQEALAKLIDGGSFDLVFVHPSRYIQSPSVLHYLETPSLYYSQEIRRVWYEKRLRDSVLGSGLKGSFSTLREKRLASLDSRNMRAASRVCVNSYHSAEAHKRAYGREVEVLYLGVELPVLSKKTQKPTTQTLKLLQVGGLEPFKNQIALVEAAAELSARGQQTEIHLVFDRYDKQYRALLESIIMKHRLTVILHENITDTALTELYGEATLTVCLADLEPFGLTPLESMAMNTPVVAVREGGYRETIQDGVQGVFARSLRSDHLADAITRAQGMTLRTGSLREYVKKQWNWSASVKRLGQSIQEVHDVSSS